ncbi:hypothetical protein PAXRUDRAFT_832701, partial [Paxillus rubicundulus Ve08.2h10]
MQSESHAHSLADLTSSQRSYRVILDKQLRPITETGSIKESLQVVAGAVRGQRSSSSSLCPTTPRCICMEADDNVRVALPSSLQFEQGRRLPSRDLSREPAAGGRGRLFGRLGF